MSISAAGAGAAVVKKKQVRFTATEEVDEDEEHEEDTLFDMRKENKRSLKGLLKGGKRPVHPDSDQVAIIRRNRSSRTAAGASRWPTSLTLCASFLGLGMSIAVLGPTFEDLAVNVKQNISNISYIFVGRSMGYIGGSVVSGIVFDCMNQQLLLGFLLLITALGLFAIPFCKTALLLTGIMSLIGVSMGFLDTGGNVLTLNTWGDKAGPHMQALHFSFAVGAFVSPVVAKLIPGKFPFPSAHFASGKNVSMEARDVSNTDMYTNVSSQFSQALNITHEKSTSMWSYIVIGSFLLLTSLIFFILYARSSPSRARAKAEETQLVARHHNVLILLLFCFFFFYVGAEVAYGSFIFTYAKDFVGMDENQAAGLNTLFWGSFAAVRGLAIIFANCLKPGTMILLDLVGCTVSSLFLTLYCQNRISVWAGTAVYGASMATTFPSGISWLEQYTKITGCSAAVFVVGAALGEMVIPSVVGFLLGKTQDNPVLMYTALGTSTISAILFPVMYKLASSHSSDSRKLSERSCSGEDSEDRKALLSSDSCLNGEEEEEDEAEQWNDADFEVIEMNDSCLINSPNETRPPPLDTAVNATTIVATVVTDPSSKVTENSTPSRSPVFLEGSPRKKLLLSLEREKND
ncbi:sodium-dependent glucose transporter 1-like [Acipenser oxyrinchus oxyrinchus]|uniref:Sodium-dependent glucose transporter 1-like n=1 Tax=Acipenser oxyrinchus oxyrinchus TaxID=40147 RepID=A0AAD8G9L4_ACIOX|nr:sodium-dependent glucose transporter 1-like [Acipenser oxyrinchus oxyrinchus]